MALWGRSQSLPVEVWEDLTAHASRHTPLDDPQVRAEWERLEQLRAHARWVDATVIPCAAYLSLTGATLAIPWGHLDVLAQVIFAIGVVSIWVVSLWQSVTGGVSPKLVTAILLARRFRPGQHVWIQAVRPGFVQGIVTDRTRTKVVVRPLSQNSPIPLSPLDVCIVHKEHVPTPSESRPAPLPSPSVSE